MGDILVYFKNFILTSLQTQLVVSEDGTQLTGELTGDIIHAERKAELLEKIAIENGISLQQVCLSGIPLSLNISLTHVLGRCHR